MACRAHGADTSRRRYAALALSDKATQACAPERRASAGEASLPGGRTAGRRNALQVGLELAAAQSMPTRLLQLSTVKRYASAT